jgi:hypothetical protein
LLTEGKSPQRMVRIHVFKPSPVFLPW